MGDNHGTSDGKTTPVVTVVVTTIATVVVTTIVTALLTLGGNFLSDGGVVRLLGGLSSRNSIILMNSKLAPTVGIVARPQ